MLDDLTAADMAGQLEELLGINYAKAWTRPLVEQLLGKADRKIIVLQVAADAPIVIEFRAETFRVTTTPPERFDMRIAIPLRDVMNLFIGRLPLRSLFRGRIRFRGSPKDALVLKKLLYVPIGDRESALAFFRHYFLDA